jgi:hypothetical protein
VKLILRQVVEHSCLLFQSPFYNTNRVTSLLPGRSKVLTGGDAARRRLRRGAIVSNVGFSIGHVAVGHLSSSAGSGVS